MIDIATAIVLLTPISAFAAYQWGRGKNKTIRALSRELDKQQQEKSTYLTELFDPTPPTVIIDAVAYPVPDLSTMNWN